MPQIVDRKPVVCRMKTIAALISDYKVIPRDKNGECKKTTYSTLMRHTKIPTKNGHQMPVYCFLFLTYQKSRKFVFLKSYSVGWAASSAGAAAAALASSSACLAAAIRS